MSVYDLLFVQIVRMVVFAFVLLSATVLILRFLKQPVERIRLIQISFLTLLTTVIIGAADIVPKIKLALPFAPKTQVDLVLANRTQEIDRLSKVDSSSSAVEDQPLDSPPRTIQSKQLSTISTSPPPASGSPGIFHKGTDIASWLRNGFVLGFVCISLLHVVYLIVAVFVTRRLIRTARPLADSQIAMIERIVGESRKISPVRFASSSMIDVPMVSGLTRPVILLPESLVQSNADPRKLENSVMHELAHVVQHDLLTWQLACLCQTFLWIQPCYWIILRELRLAQDHLADRYATGQSNDHTLYASMLAQLASQRLRTLPGTLTMAGGKSNLYRRVELILDQRIQLLRKARKGVVLSASSLILMVGVFLSFVEFTQTTDPVMAAENQSESRGDGKKDDQKNAAQKAGDNAAAATASAEHSGVVIDAGTGTPIQGVTVTVTRMDSTDWSELAVTESLTDANGKYTFTIPPDQLSRPRLYIMFDIAHPTYAPRHCGSYGYSMVAANLKAGEQPWFAKLKMVQGDEVKGRVVDGNGQPAVNVALRCETNPKSSMNWELGSFADEVTNHEGRFSIRVPRDGVPEQYNSPRLSIIPTNYCMKSIDLGNKRGDLGDIRLESGFPIHGEVRDETGKPMQGVWVNIAPEDPDNSYSYEARRSSKTNAQGQFKTHPIKPGKYTVEIRSKATGAPEKEKYANFHHESLAAMFLQQSINVTKDSEQEAFLIKAVPHILINVQHYKPDGEVTRGFSPMLNGEIEGQHIWIRDAKENRIGGFQLMAPRGIQDVSLRFITNEQSGMMVQFEGGEPSPQTEYTFEQLNDDINNVRVIRYPAAILKVRAIDETGADLKDVQIFATYPAEKSTVTAIRHRRQISYEKEGEFLRLSSIVPNVEFRVELTHSGFEPATQKFTMTESERRTVTMTLKRQ